MRLRLSLLGFFVPYRRKPLKETTPLNFKSIIVQAIVEECVIASKVYLTQRPWSSISPFSTSASFFWSFFAPRPSPRIYPIFQPALCVRDIPISVILFLYPPASAYTTLASTSAFEHRDNWLSAHGFRMHMQRPRLYKYIDSYYREELPAQRSTKYVCRLS